MKQFIRRNKVPLEDSYEICRGYSFPNEWFGIVLKTVPVKRVPYKDYPTEVFKHVILVLKDRNGKIPRKRKIRYHITENPYITGVKVNFDKLPPFNTDWLDLSDVYVPTENSIV